jgi:hypothetical protein
VNGEWYDFFHCWGIEWDGQGGMTDEWGREPDRYCNGYLNRHLQGNEFGEVEEELVGGELIAELGGGEVDLDGAEFGLVVEVDEGFESGFEGGDVGEVGFEVGGFASGWFRPGCRCCSVGRSR